MRALIVGYGRMGKLVDSLCPEFGFDVAGTVDIAEAAAPDAWPAADVAIDFSVADAVPGNVRRLAERGMNVVIGTTGWTAHEADVRRIVERTGIGVVAAPNFALGVNLFVALTERAAELFGPQSVFGAWIHEAHHATKRDAPSGTALFLEAAHERARFQPPDRRIIHSRGIHPGNAYGRVRRSGETITLTHIGARSIRLCPRSARGGTMGPSPQRVVHDEGCSGNLTSELVSWRLAASDWPFGDDDSRSRRRRKPCVRHLRVAARR